MNNQEILCQQAFTAGDLNYFRSANCTQTEVNDSLIAKAKRAATTKTVVLVGSAVLGTALIIYLSTKK